MTADGDAHAHLVAVGGPVRVRRVHAVKDGHRDPQANHDPCNTEESTLKNVKLHVSRKDTGLHDSKIRNGKFSTINTSSSH